MPSWDPMKNFPEFDGLDRKEAERLRRQTQRKVSLQPVVFVGLLLTALEPRMQAEFRGIGYPRSGPATPAR